MWHMHPCPAPTSWWQAQVSVGAYSVCVCVCVCVCVFSLLCCPLRFKNSPHTLLWVNFLLCGNFPFFMTPSPGQVSAPKSFVTVFVFHILSYLLLNTLGCIYGCLVSSASIQKLFCVSCSGFKWSADEFVGEKVVSLSYSSTILGLPPEHSHFKQMFFWHETKVKLT